MSVDALEVAAEARAIALAVQVGKLDQKLDDLSQEIGELAIQVQKINGRVQGLERAQSSLRGGLAVVTLLLPLAFFLIQSQLH